MFCGHCGKETRESDKFCGSCGKAAITTPPQALTNVNLNAPEPTTGAAQSSVTSPARADVLAIASANDIAPPEQAVAKLQSGNNSETSAGFGAQPTQQLQGKRSSTLLVAAAIVVVGLAGLMISLITHNHTLRRTGALGTPPLVTKPAVSDSAKTASADGAMQAFIDTAPPAKVASYDAHNCFDLSNHEPHALDGRLVAAIFPGSPGFADVRRGDEPEAGYVLQLKDSICIRDDGDEDGSGDPTVRISEVQLAAADDELKTSADMRSLIGSLVHAELSAAQSEMTGQQHRPLVGWVSHIVPLDDGTSHAIMIPRTIFPAVYTANQSSEMGTAATTVRGFYYALGQGNGAGASQFVIPEKRQTGAYSPNSLEHFFGPLPEPVRLMELKQNGLNEFLVAYSYGTSTRHCEIHAAVTTTQREGLNLIEKIHQVDGCGTSDSKGNAGVATNNATIVTGSFDVLH